MSAQESFQLVFVVLVLLLGIAVEESQDSLQAIAVQVLAVAIVMLHVPQGDAVIEPGPHEDHDDAVTLPVVVEEASPSAAQHRDASLASFHFLQERCLRGFLLAGALLGRGLVSVVSTTSLSRRRDFSKVGSF
jgi:hypothetical protein